jgi:hypothetical protein
MKIKNKPAYVYDIEVFKNVFHCTVFDTEKEELHKFECSIRKNNIEDMCKFFLYSDVYFVGYNNIHYDNPIINYCIEYFSNSSYTYDKICESIFNLSKVITSEKDNIDKWKKWKYAKNFLTLDLLTMLYSQALRVSLKEMQVTMMYKNVQEFNCDWQAPLSQFEIDDMIEYNINDVMSTTELLKQCTKDIDVRVDIENKFNIDCLSKDGVGTGVELLKYEYLQKTNESWWELKDKRSPMDWIPLKDVILPHISFKNPVLKSLLEEMKTLTVSPGRNGWNKKFLLNKLVVSIGVGGIHSINTPESIIPNEDEVLLDSDATSLYPSLIIQYGFVPPHLNKTVFIDIYSKVYKERVADKKAGRKLDSETKKLILNSVTGNYQNEHSWLYSPFAVMQIRMNGQLLLLMLCERLLELGATIYQVNTDGVLYSLKKAKLDELNKVIEEFQQLSRLNFETEEFTCFYQLAVNDYFGLQPNGEIKEKGSFITKVIRGKGLTPKIIPKAVIKYFLEGIKPDEYIKSCTDIKDFLMSEKTGKQWNVEYNDTPQQRTNRFYASTNGHFLYKWKIDKGEKKYQNMLTASGVTLLNNFDDLSENPKINYQYYITEANKIIAQFKTKQLSLF